MVYGESVPEHKKFKKYRNLMLGKEKINEQTEYDHVGVKNCLFGNFKPCIDDRISRGRKALNSILSAGIRAKGLNMAVITSLFWTIIVPVTTYGGELWVMRGEEIESICKFQRYSGRKCQRFNARSPNHSAYCPLGWISMEKIVCTKKHMFFRNICMSKETDTCRRILGSHTIEFQTNPAMCKINENDSPFFEILKVAERAGILDNCFNMVLNNHFYEKTTWRKMV